MTLQFANPTALLLLWSVPLVAAWWIVAARKRESRLERLVSRHMQGKLRPASSAARAAWQAALVGLGAVLMFAAMARPQWGTREETVFERGRNLVIAIDVSRSMLAEDVRPNRLERAKTDVLDLVKELRGDRAGLVAFRHKAALMCPLTTDHAFLTQAVQALDIDSAPRGETDIGEAIVKSMEAFETDEGSHNAIVLISDGEDLSGKALRAAEEAAKRNIPIFTVGLGNRAGARIPGTESAFVTHDGKEVITRLDHATLHAIARATRGAYVPVETAGMTKVTLGTLYRQHLRKLSAQDYKERRERTRIERYQLFLLPSILALLGAAFLSRGRLMAVARGKTAAEPPRLPDTPLKDMNPPPQPLKQIGIVILCGGLVSVAAATNGPQNTQPQSISESSPEAQALGATATVPPGRKGGRVAQAMYARGKYAEAAGAYEDAARDAGGDLRDELRFNAGVSLFKAGEYDEAAGALRDLTTSDAVGPGASLGLGSALFRASGEAETNQTGKAARRAGLLKRSGEAYREAARASHPPEAAQGNLAVVLEQLPEAEQEAKIEKLMEKYGQAAGHDIIHEMLTGQRRLQADMLDVATNRSPARIARLEAIADAQETSADLWIPLKGKLLAAVPEPDKQAALSDVIENTRDAMRDSAERLRDLDEGEARAAAAASRRSIYHLWKGVAPYPLVLDEDLHRQTNAMAAAHVAAAADQAEAGDLTRLFTERFMQAVPEQAEAADGGATNAPGQISAETRQDILDLAAEAASVQTAASEALEKDGPEAARPHQQRAVELLEQIRELLPKDQQSQQQQQDKQREQDQQRQDQQEQEPREQPQEQPEQQPEEQPQDSEPEESPPEKKEDEISGEQLRRLLDRALQREKEHEAEKRERARRIPMAPSERDW